MKSLLKIFVFFLLILPFTPCYSQIPVAPERADGIGPFPKLIIRGVTLINSTGAPPMGPVDIVVENNIIKQIKSVGYPGAPVFIAWVCGHARAYRRTVSGYPGRICI